jgi:hypothetical protein
LVGETGADVSADVIPDDNDGGARAVPDPTCDGDVLPRAGRFLTVDAEVLITQLTDKNRDLTPEHPCPLV